MSKKFKVPGVSFSAKRALGVTAAKRKIAKATGIPTTKQGRQAKIGRMATGSGCLLPVIVVFLIAAIMVVLLA